MSARVVRYGIVGCGGAAVDVAAAIARLGTARVTATNDLRPELAADLAAPSGGTVHATLDGLLSDPLVDAVYVALPHDLLAGVAARVLASGRSALVEKPMAIEPPSSLACTLAQTSPLAALRCSTSSLSSSAAHGPSFNSRP